MNLNGNRIDVADDVQAAWEAVIGRVLTGWQPVWFDEPRGILVVYCANTAWQMNLRLVGPKLSERINAALPEPRIKKMVAAIWEVRVLVTGSRSWTDDQAVADALLDAWHDITQTIGTGARMIVVHGDCPTGADAIAKQWARSNDRIQEPHPADWAAPCPDNCLPKPHRKTSAKHGEYCPLAGHRRNQFMVDLGADLVLAFHRDNSRGTDDCIRRAKKAGIPVRILEAQHA
jgi:hypothetical protein